MKKVNQFIIGLFICFIGGISIMHMLSKDTSFSEVENRELMSFPKFSWERLVAGDFTDEFEVYLSDQFIKKEFWTGLKASAEKLLLKQENNGVYFASDSYLLEKVEKTTEQLNKNVETVKDFVNNTKGISSSIILVPTAIEIYPEKLPPFAQTVSQTKIIRNIKQNLSDSVNYIDPTEVLLKSKDEKIYFRTDHHWTMRGAYIGYVEVAKTLGFEPYKREDFLIENVSEDFYGTHYVKANDYKVKPDKIEIFKPKFDMAYEVELDDNQIMNTLYNWDYLKKRDQYSFFLDGNHRKVIIRSNVQNGSKILIIKDSYAHAIVPFLANHFEEIHMIDLRYFRESVPAYLKENEIEDVLFLYNIVNFAEDRNLIWLRQ